MSQATKSRFHAPRKKAAWALKSTTTQVHLTTLLGVGPSTVSRYCSAEIENDVSRCYALVRKLVNDRSAEAGHIIAGMMDVAQDAAEGLDVPLIRARLNLAQDKETEAQQAEDVAQHRVLRAISRSSAEDATPDDLHELAAAIEAHDEAILHENAAHAVVLYYARAYVAKRGTR